MTIHKWQAEFKGETWGADGETITPSELADFVRTHEGATLQTPYGKPYTVTIGDPGAVLDVFQSEFDPHGEARNAYIDADPIPTWDGKEF